MKMNKKLMTLASAAVLMGAANANAAYVITGSGDTFAPSLSLSVASAAISGTGTVQATAGGDFVSATFNTVVSVTSPFDPALLQVIETTYQITDTAGNGTTVVTGCSDAQNLVFCDDYPLGQPPAAINPSTFNFDFSDLNNIVWGTFSVGVTGSGLGVETTINYTASGTYDVVPSAVPVPAAAWLFGSALVGLAGVGRRRKA
ncbi:VPLPA-CTERM sorting domain-containing protein [Oceanicoccus sagamiensis]|uniref:PEP-CTERM protein-sorting domain-containing protein n=1 Tax=Oceanicoccus sagamiensis TaxID=716816 RepID=A0A1X9NMB4_9GAMM|nr:VPLPA-CTERM sorting domain-containing protein [Oceanicoccus sagamiensis]ARN75053.1 hypothetical protein BST96_13580 [Oceanicoccus sagamiensis]